MLSNSGIYPDLEVRDRAGRRLAAHEAVRIVAGWRTRAAGRVAWEAETPVSQPWR